ncbi:hypothetical protein PSTG_02217 [Puccinia striiformis f. sp. tritici PST-78]|uniref:Uncharacterized protein n=1 Tax=Puccinia striiformis f. sp. tritici PST-78 TaxID=1165861 RepID=A0A0L0W0C2_9BASI|nr:hypothetical protein PSTG_02217 [Puccinia striiformis f. sp. tritici PST-78]
MTFYTVLEKTRIYNVTFFGKNARPCLRSAASSSSRIAQSSAKFMDTSIRESPLEARFEYKVKISPVQDDRPPDHSALNPSDQPFCASSESLENLSTTQDRFLE